MENICQNLKTLSGFGSFSIYEQPKWERIVASTQVSFRVSIWVRIRVWIRVRVRVRLGLYFGCSYIEKGPRFCRFVDVSHCDDRCLAGIFDTNDGQQKKFYQKVFFLYFYSLIKLFKIMSPHVYFAYSIKF